MAYGIQQKALVQLNKTDITEKRDKNIDRTKTINESFTIDCLIKPCQLPCRLKEIPEKDPHKIGFSRHLAEKF